MSMKTLKAQLMASVAMVLVAAISLSSATYAWFVNNNSVEAKGVSIYATTDDSLLIAGKEDSSYTDFSSIGTSTINEALHPSTSYDGQNFAKLNSDVEVRKAYESGGMVGDVVLNATKAETGSLITATNASGTAYYAEAQYKLKAVGSKLDVYVTDITIDSSAIASSYSLDKAIRVSIKCDDKCYVYNPNSGTNLSEGVGQKKDEATSGWTLASKTYDTCASITAGSVASGDVGKKLLTLNANESKTVTVRVWFEGQDENCYTNNNQTGVTKAYPLVVKFGSVVAGE